MNIQIQPRYAQKEKWSELAEKYDFSFEIDELAFDMPDEKKRELVDYYKNTGRVTSLHGAFIDINPVSSNEEIANLSRQKCEESCMLAKELGATNVVFHSSCFPFLRGSYLDVWVKRSADFYCNLARKYELNLYIENSFDLDPEPLYRLMKQCEVPYVRVCLDFGHMNYSREPFETWMDVLKDYIGYVHLSDNMGEFDDHLAIGRGIVPFDIIDDMLKDMPKDTKLTLETGDFSCTTSSIDYLERNNWIIKYNKQIRQSFAHDYFDTAKSAPVRDFLLSEKEKQQIKLKKIRNRESTYARRNEIITNIFSRYLSNEIVNKALEHPDSLELGGKKRELTMLMSDLHGFTQMSEEMPAEDLIRVLNNYFAVMMEIIHRYHGTIIDIIGDGMLVAFGVFDGTDSHADKAVGAAIEMQCYMEEVNKWNRKNGYPPLHMGIGINTGNVVVGNIGSNRHIKFGIVGKNVNLCSRIESYTYNGQILVSQSTLDACESELTIASEEVVYPKGMSTQITLYHVTRINGDYNKEFIPEQREYEKVVRNGHIRFSYVYSKHRAVVMNDGEILAVSETGAILRTDEPIRERDNIVIDIGDTLFCKVKRRINPKELPKGSDKAYKINCGKDDMSEVFELSFTSMPLEFEDWMYKLTHPQE